MFKLTLRSPSPIPLDVTGVTPDRVATLSASEVAQLAVLHGNRHLPLGEFFDVSAGTSTGTRRADLQFAGDTANVHNIGAGMTSGFVFVEGDAGRHVGAKMAGGRLVVDAGVGDWLGAEMTGGEIEVRGDAGSLVGAAYRGSRRGMRGGAIVVRGGAGDEVGLLMRRGVIVVAGRTGDFAAASMIAGTVVALGGTGRRTAAGMKRGTLVIDGPVEMSLGFVGACEYDPPFLPLLARVLVRHDVSLPVGPVDCYRGDLVTGGRGEVWRLRPP